MPLAFHSINHGSIAFGFFNIDSDMLLLERYFLFATEFCQYISDMAESEEEGAFEAAWEVYFISDRKEIGDLMGAIHGMHDTGFMGELYCRFPFPERPEAFKQKPDGLETQAVVEGMIKTYAEVVSIPVTVDKKAREIRIGDYGFTRTSFQELITYVWQGGMPRWKDEVRPDYVRAMRKKIERNRKGIFEGIVFED
ncbi:MAG: hypothetical protein GY849_22565 [Deltaproteobacteria bacterium]|nr:hypothetical protein [Deltaproteobacteria bacterium]